MYIIELFPVAPLEAADVDGALAVALDADQPGAARVVVFHKLRGAPPARREEVARALVTVLNEPRNWIPSEALLCIDALAPDVVIGVDGRGLVAAGDTRAGDLVDDGVRLFCPVLGPVATPRELGALSTLASLPWRAHTPSALIVEVNGVRRVVPWLDVTSLQAPHGFRLEARPGDVVLTAEAGVRVNGQRLPPKVSTRRIVPGDVVESGPMRARLIESVEHAHLRGIVAVAGAGRVAVGNAVAFAGHHVAVLGAREVAVVCAGAAGRVPLPPERVAEGAEIVVDRVGPHEVVLARRPREQEVVIVRPSSGPA